MRLVLLALPAVALLAGCAPKPMAITSVTNMKSLTSDEVGGAAYSKRYNEIRTENMKYLVQSVPVRTYARASTENGDKYEIGNVPCKAETTYFSAEFVTPTTLQAPTYGPLTDVLNVTCLPQSTSPIVAVNAPYNQTMADTQQNLQTAGAGFGLVGALAGAVIGVATAAANDTSNDVYNYREIKIDVPEARLAEIDETRATQ